MNDGKLGETGREIIDKGLVVPRTQVSLFKCAPPASMAKVRNKI